MSLAARPPTKKEVDDEHNRRARGDMSETKNIVGIFGCAVYISNILLLLGAATTFYSNGYPIIAVGIFFIFTFLFIYPIYMTLMDTRRGQDQPPQ
jgi:hypothetical protein